MTNEQMQSLRHLREEVEALEADIERHMKTIHKRDREIEELRAQNAELLEALERMTRSHKSMASPGAFPGLHAYADAAIAKAKGGAA